MKHNKTKILFTLIGVLFISIVMVTVLADRDNEGELSRENSEQKEELDVADVYTDHYSILIPGKSSSAIIRSFLILTPPLSLRFQKQK